MGIFDTVRKSMAVAGIAAIAASSVAGAALAQNKIYGERYIPTIWVDPDGCEHWVMDDGLEGFMTPHVTRDGIPVCRRGNTCGVVSSDQLFETDKAAISA
ncbi:MAG: OmpA family protein, partial [Pseudomonadota bacterium]|nr:OmpA family protein [Pseudomonadota bacterium]